MNAETMILTDRQLREKEFYEKYVTSFDITSDVDLSPVSGKETRPWNSYWSMYHLAEKCYQPGHRLLDFGSGPGDNALRFSHIGYLVEGFDICQSNVDVSRTLFKKYGVESGKFQVSAAEKLPYESDCFHFIAGIDILHHVDVEKSLLECRRVLKPGGIAVFREPFEVPFLDWIRNTLIVRAFAPKSKSFELHITEDERKLNHRDMEIIKSIFPSTKIKQYFLLARFDKFFREGSDPKPSFLEKIDYHLMSVFPFLKVLGGVRIIIMRKK